MVASGPASVWTGDGTVAVDRRGDGVALGDAGAAQDERVVGGVPRAPARRRRRAGRRTRPARWCCGVVPASSRPGPTWPSSPSPARRSASPMPSTASRGGWPPCPGSTIAAITGYALGGGLELALACDLRVVSDDARLGQPEILLGIVPGGGATQRLPRLVGVSRAKDLIFTGRQVAADEALRIGLADRVVPRDDVLDEALSLAASLAAGPLVALAAAKRVIDDGVEGPLDDGLELEVAAFVAVSRTEDAGRGVTSFLEHGPGQARFVGR